MTLNRGLVYIDSLYLLLFLKESDYFTPQGEFRVDKAGSPTLLNCLMYKMSYYRFGEMQVSAIISTESQLKCEKTNVTLMYFSIF